MWKTNKGRGKGGRGAQVGMDMCKTNKGRGKGQGGRGRGAQVGMDMWKTNINVPTLIDSNMLGGWVFEVDVTRWVAQKIPLGQAHCYIYESFSG